MSSGEGKLRKRRLLKNITDLTFSARIMLMSFKCSFQMGLKLVVKKVSSAVIHYKLIDLKL